MEEIVEGLYDKISRNPIYDAVNILLKKRVLTDEKRNRRDHRIMVNKENLLVTVPPQIELFGTAFIDLVKSSSKETEALYKKYGTSQERIKKLATFELHTMVIIPLDILFYVIDTFTLTSTLLWPRKLQNHEIIKELYAVVFSTISDTQLKLYDYLENLDFDYYLLQELKTVLRYVGSPLGLISKCLQHYKIINLTDKMEVVADTLWYISRELPHNEEVAGRFHTKSDWREAIVHLHPREYDYIPSFLKNETK